MSLKKNVLCYTNLFGTDFDISFSLCTTPFQINDEPFGSREPKGSFGDSFFHYLIIHIHIKIKIYYIFIYLFTSLNKYLHLSINIFFMCNKEHTGTKWVHFFGFFGDSFLHLVI